MNTFRIISILLLNLVYICFDAYCQDSKTEWRLKNRVQLGFEQDNNVEESLTNAESAKALKLHYHSQVNRRWRRASLQLTYQGGYQVYWEYTSENKMINEIAGRFSYQLSPRLAMGVDTWGRIKLFLNRDPRYGIGTVGAFINVYLPGRISCQVTGRAEGLDYATTDHHDYYGQGVFIRFGKRFLPALTVSPEIGFQSFNFNRQAFDFQSQNNWRPLPETQSDHNLRFGCTIDGSWQGYIINVSYFYEKYNSNSYGFNFDRHRLNIVAAKKLFGVLLRVYANLQRKSYTDDLLPFYPLEIDTEKEESNFLVTDISRELVPSIVLLVRLAWYENESPWPNLYYSKRLANLGFEFRF